MKLDFWVTLFNNSSKSVEGHIFKILPGSIAIKTVEGKIWGIKGSDIDSFEEGAVVNNKTISPTNTSNSSCTPIISDNISIDIPKTKEENNKIVQAETPANINKQKEDETPDSIIDTAIKSKEYNISTADTSYKVGDKIPLDVLHRIDPELKKKAKITPSEKKSSGKMRTLGNDLASLVELVKDKQEIDDLRNVHAIGEIKFVKPDMNFGFYNPQNETYKQALF